MNCAECKGRHRVAVPSMDKIFDELWIETCRVTKRQYRIKVLMSTKASNETEVERIEKDLGGLWVMIALGSIAPIGLVALMLVGMATSSIDWPGALGGIASATILGWMPFTIWWREFRPQSHIVKLHKVGQLREWGASA